MFPQGGPGAALLLLRTSVAVIFFMNAIKLVDGTYAHLPVAISLLISVSLTIGFLTPYLSVIACAAAVAYLLMGFHVGDLIYLFPILDAVALALLGPGAYSIDARLFGRRVTVVRPRKDTSRY